jgi:Leucine-rich repeat (LRR) protein
MKDSHIYVNDKYETELRQLNNLEILSVSSNQIIALPEWIGSLPKLKELHIDNNKLKELPNRLTLAPELTMISVCVNRLLLLVINM